MKKGYHINNKGQVLKCSTTPEQCEFIGGQFSNESDAYNSDAYKTVIGQVSNITTLKKARMAKHKALRNNPQSQEQRKLQDQLEHQKKLDRFKKLYELDAELSWGTIEPDQKSIYIYRSGVAKPLRSDERGAEAESYELADSVRPDGRVGRLDGFCAAPSLGGVSRWLKANNRDAPTTPESYAPYKMQVSLDDTYIYSIKAWEQASLKESLIGDKSGIIATNSPYYNYWSTGITLREYIQLSKDDPITYNPTEWEMLISPDQLQTEPEKVSIKDIAKATYTEYDSDRENILKIGKTIS